MKTTGITFILLTISIWAIAQEKPCLPDSLQYLLYAKKIERNDTLFHYPTELYRLFNFKNYRYRNCLKPNTISKIRQVFRGEIDYLPQEVRSNRYGILSGTDAQRRIQKIKSKFPKDSLTTEMALDTIIFKENYENITNDISHSLSLPRTDLILKIGQIYLVELILDLEWALTQDPKIYPPLQIKLALARMCVKKYQDYFLDFYKDFVTEVGENDMLFHFEDINRRKGLYEKEKVLEYINTQESWELLLKENLNPNFIAYHNSESTNYKKVYTSSPKFSLKILSNEDKQKYDTLNIGIHCSSYISPQEAERNCPNANEIRKFNFEIQKKYIKDFVMPYEYEGQ